MSIDHALSLASACRQTGRLDLATRHYRDALALEPDCWEACFGLAQVLIRQDCFDEAIGWLTPLLERPGDHAVVSRQLGLAETCAGRHERGLAHFRRALEHAPDDPALAHTVANLEQALGLAREADASFRRALKLKPLVTIPATVAPADFRVLFVFAPGAGNTPFEFLIERARFESNIITLLPDMVYDAGRLRLHADVVVNLVSDVDRGHALLAPAQALVTDVGRPVVNAPNAIARTSRDAVARQLADIPGCRVPQTALHRKAGLRSTLSGPSSAPLSFPLLARPAGSHGGDDFERMEHAAQLLAFVDRFDAEHFYLTPYVDYRSGDGHFRKYRFVYVDGEILPYHLAIDSQWKVHHATTDMARHTWMQDEERAFLDDPWHVFGPAQRNGLQAIRDAIGLDYFGIDCGLDRDGAVVVFEVNASMLVHGNNEQFPYKTAAVERIRHAFRALLERRATAACRAAS
ncbi:TPR domain-containing protein [Burkholderia lata]|uniref:TPR domain-containing protein n=1 Tax=Burkholderia lata (strain ATCC 17760 / DSM 23089 / LMG 22485 / NCIMB 9086 / R18194 / 383) TaxID=482957 RepID=A0A6P3BDM1_BURL3|nr:tetratricopeptide repeat protein [Burkholderia lata]VWD54928.1 TPR domain-containing protein [Burkholderia lata]